MSCFVATSILSIEVHQLHLGQRSEMLCLSIFIMLMKPVASFFPFGVMYIRKWKIHEAGSVITECASPCCSVFLLSFLSYLRSFLLNNSNPHTSTLERVNPVKAGPRQ